MTLIFSLLFVSTGALAGKAKIKKITGFIEKDVSGKDYLYVDTGSKIYTLRFKSVYLNNQGVLKRKRIPNAQVTLRVKRKDIVKVKKIKYKWDGYR